MPFLNAGREISTSRHFVTREIEGMTPARKRATCVRDRPIQAIQQRFRADMHP